MAILTEKEAMKPLTEEQIAMLDALKDEDIVYDNDCPKLSGRMIEKARAYRQSHPTNTSV